MDAGRDSDGGSSREFDIGAARTIVVTLGARLRVLAAGTVMFGACVVLLVTRGGAGAWIGTVVFGVLFAVILIGVVHPGRLILQPESVEIINQFGRNKLYRFGLCGPFRAFRQTASAKQAWVVFDYEGVVAHSRFQRANASMTGANSYLRLDAYGLKADDAAELLNGYRGGALGKSADAGEVSEA